MKKQKYNPRKSPDRTNLELRDGAMGRGWYIAFDMRIGGKKKKIRAFGGYDRQAARLELSRLRLEKLDEKRGVKRPLENVLFSDFADEWLDVYSKINKLSSARDEFSIDHLKAFKGFEKKYLSEITALDVESYKAKRKADGRSPGTINRELACLKTIFNKAVEWGKLESNQIARVKKFKEPPGKERILNDSEIKRLLEVAKPHLRPILIVLLNTGMRKSEALSLKWENVDFRKGYIYVGAADSKSGRSRTIPMSSLVFEMLQALRSGTVDGCVFSNPMTGEKFKDVTASFKTACKDAEIEHVRIHDLRHTAASRMVEAGVDLVTVSKILGHASIQMTMRYAHPTPAAMKAAVEKLGDVLAGRRRIGDTVEIPKPVTDLKRYL